MHHSKGSLWRKWDLHFHTPSSFDYQNKSITNQQIIDGLIKKEIRLVAITDHHKIDVERIHDLQKLGKGKVTILPGIELRSELGGNETIHYIGIFPENCDLEHIWGKLQNQLNLTDKDIKEKGGDKHIYVPIREAAELIHKWGVISIHAGVKSNSIENISNRTLFQQAIKKDLIKDGIIDILEIGKAEDVDDYQTIVFPDIGEYLPLVLCSDNHKITEYNLKTNCWFRADTNFHGLQQVLVEPQDRIYIGEKPKKRVVVSKNRTRYIQTIAIQKKQNSELEDAWFEDISLDLNHDLIAIIGNKGTGKSALAEIIGLLGNTHNKNSFSFLEKERFLNPINKLAQHFVATITWENGYTRELSLHDDVDRNAPEQVTCIPQGLFEDICNEVTSDENSKFNQELRKVIFSHVPKADQLEKDSLESLIAHLTDEIDDAIDILKSQLRDKNELIAKIEVKLTSDHRDKLINQIQEKQQELQAHKKAKPIKVSKPTDSVQKNSEISTQLNNLESERTELESNIEQSQNQETENAILATTSSKILDALTNFESQFQEFQKQVTLDMERIGINFRSIVNLKINRQPVEAKVLLHKQKRQELAKLLDSTEENSLTRQIEQVKRNISLLQDKLDEPNKLFEAYRTELREWEEQKNQIIGSIHKVDSLAYLENQLEQLNELPIDLQSLKDARTELTKRTFENIQNLVSKYRQLYSPVQQFSENNDVSKETFDLKFDVSIVDQGFEDHFFDWIGRGTAGSFYGGEEGIKTLKKIIERHDFNNWSGVEGFLTDIDEHLNYDKRQPNTPKVSVTGQLRKNKDLKDFYNFIYSLDYLRPQYVLKLDGKELSQLSPGERGALLLIFYLLIDKSEKPLIIDQPEENLDNQTVYTHLVKAIKSAKSRRQIIVVTHNPNLAVVCDAEQIICCSIDKKNGYRIEYYTGAIENPESNRRIVDILEGTKPALTNRWRKYSPFREAE